MRVRTSFTVKPPLLLEASLTRVHVVAYIQLCSAFILNRTVRSRFAELFFNSKA